MPKPSEENQLARLQQTRHRERQEKGRIKARVRTRPKENFINPAEAILLVLIASICDLVTFLTGFVPGLGSVVSGIIWLGFFLWVKFKQIKGAPRIWSRVLMVGGIIEIIPIIGVLPAWLGFMLTIILLDRFGKAPFVGRAVRVGSKI